MDDLSKKILFAESLGWDSLYRVGSHHYADYFCKNGYGVCWVTHPVSPFHRLHRDYKSFSSELAGKYRIWRSGGEHRGPLLHYTPLTLLPYGNAPLLSSDLVINNTLRFTVPPLGRYLKKHGFDNVDILWFTNPAMAGLKDMVGYKRCVFRIPDDTAAFDAIPESFQRIERNLAEKADIVFVTSRSIQERYSWAGDKVHYLPNGVDFDHFHAGEHDMPGEYRSIPSPRVVYIGSIAEWFDVELVEAAAARLKDYSFVLIGQPRIDISHLTTLRNVFPLGGKNYKAIPSFLRNADVGIIPFKRTRLVDSVNPIKLYEYMATGLPVVATRWKTLEDIGSPAFLADSARDFVAGIEQAARAGKRETYVDFARANSWQERIGDVTRVLGI